jgi:NADH-ubiquinone oxidoreductase chain 5
MFLAIVFIPLINSIIAGLAGRWIGRNGARWLTVTGMLGNLFLTLFLICHNLTEPVVFHLKLGTWISSELLHITWGFNCDNLVLTMFFVVNLVSSLVHIYSCSYMAEDPHLPRFMSYLSLFTFFMLLLVTADNLLQLFLGWEGVGICSYLLINFWFTRIQANKSAIQALIVNRISDVALTLGIITIFCAFRSIEFGAIFSLTPFFTNQSVNILGWEGNLLNLISLLLLLGAMGKSAQIFLHTWLPSAMEGPTPVSALIHAATMVTAGVFLIIKCSPIFEYADTTLMLVALAGGLTAFFSSTVGLVQYDMKKVIAYSTCSQLGYMVFACGLSAYNISLFHLMNHAVFKALLFLSAGSVIHSLSNEQDMRKMGGLSQLLPFAYVAMGIGSLALIGFPFLTGYYSKDIILELGYSQYNLHGSFVHWLGTVTAFFTAFYSFRLIYLSFIKEMQAPKPVANNIHESAVLITGPLAVLVLGSIFLGYVTKDLFAGVGSPFLDHIILTLPGHNSFFVAEFLPFYIKNLPFFLSVLSVALVTLLYQVLSNYTIMYHPVLKKIHRFLSYKWYFDLLYNRYINLPVLRFAFRVPFELIDKGIIELMGPWGLYSSFFRLSLKSKEYQTGLVYQYAFYILSTLLLLLLALTFLTV